MEEQIKTLAPHVRRSGFDYSQVWREGNYAIYRQTREGSAILAFEAIKVKTCAPFEIRGKQYPRTEVYPSSEEWGLNGWTARTIEDAHKYVARMRGVE